jgi:hypothetical protein
MSAHSPPVQFSLLGRRSETGFDVDQAAVAVEVTVGSKTARSLMAAGERAIFALSGGAELARAAIAYDCIRSELAIKGQVGRRPQVGGTRWTPPDRATLATFKVSAGIALEARISAL